MYKVACPACGAEVQFRSAMSVMAVCEYCQSTLMRDAESVKDMGKMSAVIEDFSPIQINTTGIYQGKAFGVVGRIQLRYDAGFWNEWYVLFDDGSPGWLSDASGKYVMTLPLAAPAKMPAFDQIKPGNTITLDKASFTACDVRTAQCTGGQGELPFRVGEGWQARVADFRTKDRFVTLDFSDDSTPAAYLGNVVTLDSLQCQLLRTEDQITQRAGKLSGKMMTLECPSCGSPLKYRAGAAMQVTCPACHADVDCTGDKAIVLQKHSELAQITPSIALGSIATIDGIRWNAIGFMRCRETRDPTEWTEYLFFHPLKGFMWLVETDDGWDKVEVLDTWPDQFSASAARLGQISYIKYVEYGSEVIYAAGAFNWRVSVGDKTWITDYRQNGQKLTQERSSNEISWSRSESVSAEQIASWLGKPHKQIPSKAIDRDDDDEVSPLKGTAKALTWMLLILNIPILFGSGFAGVMIILSGLLALWWPILKNKDDGDGDYGSGGDGDGGGGGGD
ncbi:ribosomal protein S27E [Chitinivorax tropicus]|uniref:Ribosomal protein S27E n=1 Tax=Chitinivorax tropicus TaxID=714531 RepID=A0A840MUA0_9PROT|nr:DUF4178 domain-containing protein [Chitinivorax tropicus]MBB5019946.1 ribosomal protein S27E [Chitinivorax tropicus]